MAAAAFAELHGAECVRAAGGVATHAQRQSRSQGAACRRRSATGRTRVRSAAQRSGRSVERDLGRGVEAGAGECTRQLLRVGWTLAFGDATDVAGAHELRGGVTTAGAVPAADGSWAGVKHRDGAVGRPAVGAAGSAGSA